MKKSIYVIVKGRNGNQLFQYAFARRIQEMTGGELILDFSEMGFNKSAGKYGPEKHMNNVLDYFSVKPYKYVDAAVITKEVRSIGFNYFYIVLSESFIRPFLVKQNK